jgi:hypothetical protein
VSDLAAARSVAVDAIGHHFGCAASFDADTCDCGTAGRAGDLVSAVVAALGVAAVPEGHARLVLDLPRADVDQLLRDLKRINDADAQFARLSGYGWVLPRWRAEVMAAAAGTLADSVPTHRVSHASRSGFALGPLVHAISTSEAASAIGVSEQRVRGMCRAGVLDARQAVGGRREWTIDEASVLAAAGRRGRPAGADVPLSRSAASGGGLT